MILNKFIWFISQAKTIIFPALTMNFALFTKHPSRFASLLTAQDTSKLAESETNTGKCNT